MVIMEHPLPSSVEPELLPTPLPGEDEIDRELVTAVRNGFNNLEDEDHLITELVKVYRAYRAHGREVYWAPPSWDESEAAAAPDLDIGYEIKFMAETGHPIAMTLMASKDHGEPIYTKAIPRKTFPRRPYQCPLSPKMAKHDTYARMGFDPCDSDGFANFARWSEHFRLHGDFLMSLNAVSGGANQRADLWDESVKSAGVAVQQRRLGRPSAYLPMDQ